MMSDYISREAALEVFCDCCTAKEFCQDKNKCEDYDRIVSIPTADVREVVYAHWISVLHKWARICSRCEHDEPYKFTDDDTNIFNFCPNCGAKMEEQA